MTRMSLRRTTTRSPRGTRTRHERVGHHPLLWKLFLFLVVALGLATGAWAARPYPILFVTQVPIPYDFTAIGSVFGNHEGDIDTVGRGGDLYLLLPNGTLRNLTGEAGLGVASGFQGATSIAVRDPCVHWSGNRALFSMVTGAPTAQYQVGTWFWQIYEVTNLGDVLTGAVPDIVAVAHQPAGYNNVSPCYASDDRILFTSDRPRNGWAHLHPQLDEYEEAETVTGLWSLDAVSGELVLLDHAPSGDFTPIVDSFGRVIFTRWDHLQRDQQADSDWFDEQAGDPPTYGTFNWSSESAAAVPTATRAELFPEPRASRTDLLTPLERGHSFNHFFPWMVNQDGSGLETLNHIGRHELHSYFDRALNDDALDEFIASVSGRTNPNSILNLLHLRERSDSAPGAAGTYVGVDAPEFYTHSGGQVVSLHASPLDNPDDVTVTYVTHRDTAGFDDTPGPCHSGFYRNPLPLSDGALVAAHAGERSASQPETRQAANDGTRASPVARYRFRLSDLVPAGAGCTGYLKYGAPLTPGIVKTLWYWDPDVQVTYSGVTMWELSPVEVRARPVPPAAPPDALPPAEAGVFADEAVPVGAFRDWLAARDLALIVSRDVTTRDAADRQQPFNLAVPGGAATSGGAGTVYPVEYLQLFQADLLRGLGGTASPRPGRRVLGRPMRDGGPHPPPSDGSAPAGAVEVALDGSVAALVPAHRALSWQLTDDAGTPSVRERYWLTFQAGEIRVCADCHGVNTADQAGDPPAENPPQALAALLQFWKTILFDDNFESGGAGLWSARQP